MLHRSSTAIQAFTSSSTYLSILRIFIAVVSDKFLVMPGVKEKNG
jgi:hypothetical protein